MKVRKRVGTAILATVLLLSLCTGCTKETSTEQTDESGAVVHTTKVVTLNMLATQPSASGYTYGYYGDNMQTAADYSFERRVEYIRAMMNYANPDVMLLQEFSGPNYWGKTMKMKTTDTVGVYTTEQFPDFLFVNHGNRRGVLYEVNNMPQAFDCHNFVAFDNTKFEYLASGTRFVTADGTRENSWTDNATGGLCNDLGDYTWVVLKDKETGFVSIYTTIHVYTNAVQRQAYVVQNLQYVTEYLETVSAEYDGAPVIVAGDFNLDPDQANYRVPYEHMTKVARYKDSNTKGDKSGTAREFGNSAGSSNPTIDYIFVNGGEPTNYEVLDGQVQITDSGEFKYVADSPMDGTMYDVSDHQPVYAEVVYREDSKLRTADISGMYFNPNTAEDVIVTEDTKVSFKDNTLKFDTTKALSAVKLGDGLWANIVEDETEGKVLRIVAADEINKVNAKIDFQALAGDVNMSDYKKMIITYCTEFSLVGCEVNADVRVGDGTSPTTIVTNTYGDWKKMTVRKGSLKGTVNTIEFEGESELTGLMRGDAIYISSIVFEK